MGLIGCVAYILRYVIEILADYRSWMPNDFVLIVPEGSVLGSVDYASALARRELLDRSGS